MNQSLLSPDCSFLSLLERLQNCFQLRQPLEKVTDAYRVVNGRGDGLQGVVLDRYGSHWQLQFFDQTWLCRQKDLVAGLQKLFRPESVVVKQRLSPAGEALAQPEMERVLGSDSVTVVREAQALFQVDLMDTMNPGLFLDMRPHRLWLRNRMQPGQQMLNLFCYTGAFSVHGRLAQVQRAVNVDVSAKILDKVRQNYTLQKIEPVAGEFFRGDAREYVQWALRKGLRFHHIVLDPPSFARSHNTQKKSRVFRVQDDLMSLACQCYELLEPHGLLLVSTNFSDWTLAELQQQLQECLSPEASVVHQGSQGEDFPGSGLMKESCLSVLVLQRRPKNSRISILAP